MTDLYRDHWRNLKSSRTLRLAVLLSVLAHAGGLTLFGDLLEATPQDPVSVSYDVQVVTLPSPEPEVKPVETPVPPPPPPPPPPKPKPKPKVAKKVEKKPEPKPEPKPEVRPKPKPKPKPKPEVVKKPVQKPMPQPEVVAKAPPQKSGVQQEQLPPLLNAWGRAVQRKVEKYWTVPGGIRLSDANREVTIVFEVDRDGQLTGRPRILWDAEDPALGESGIRAILFAEPLPPLPPEYRERRQEVVYVFSLVK